MPELFGTPAYAPEQPFTTLKTDGEIVAHLCDLLGVRYDEAPRPGAWAGALEELIERSQDLDFVINKD